MIPTPNKTISIPFSRQRMHIFKFATCDHVNVFRICTNVNVLCFVCCKNHENRKKESTKGMEIGKMKDEMKFKIFLRKIY